MRGSPKPLSSAVPLQGDLRGSDAGDAYAHIIAQLEKIRPAGGCVAITSASQGEGKSTTAANLALAIAVRHQSVLLMDLSFRRPYLEKIFGQSPMPHDLVEVLKGSRPLQNVLCTRNDIGLHLAMLKRPLDFIPKVEAIRKLLQDVRPEYRWVLLDCDALSDGDLIDSITADAGTTLLVVQERKTKAKALKNAVARCGPANTCVLLNQHR